MKIGLLVVFLAFTFAGFSTENKSVKQPQKLKLTTNIDFVSSHVWRGGKSGAAPSLEPSVEFGFGNFTVGSWTAATFDKEYRELDIYALYSIGNFSVGIYDYYCPPEKPEKSRFTDFHGIDTYHLFSVDFVYYGTPKFPVKFTASTMMYGMDFNQTTGDYYYSTYLEAVYSKNWKNNALSALVGLTTHEGIYAGCFAFMNSELMYKKSFTFKDFSIPVFAKIVYNPIADKAWLIGGVSLNRVFGV